MKTPVLATFLFLAVLLPAQAQERITDYHARVEVMQDARILVTETIGVNVESGGSDHGILRDFSMTCRSDEGRLGAVSFLVDGVKRDGHPEPFRVVDTFGGWRIYAGDAKAIIPPGRHVYEISYETRGLVGFYEDFDEICWNVTGSGWKLPIDAASAEIILPEGAEVIQSAGTAGKPGSRDSAHVGDLTGRGMFFEGTGPLAAGEGLTVSVGFRKGVVMKPPGFRLIVASTALHVFAGPLGLLLTFLVWLAVWLKVGRSPPRRGGFPEDEPPEGISPAAARFIARMGWDDKIFAIVLVNMAVKGWLIITHEEGCFTLYGREGKVPLSYEEKKVQCRMGIGNGETLALRNTEWAAISGARDLLRSSLEETFGRAAFHSNGRWNIPGFLLAAATMAAMFVYAHTDVSMVIRAMMILYPPGIWCFFAYLEYGMVVTALRKRGKRLFWLVPAALFLPVLVFGAWLGSVFLYRHVYLERIAAGGIDVLFVMDAACFLGLVAMVLIFPRLLKVPTVPGQAVRDHLAGFRRYLGMAGKGSDFGQAQMTPEVFGNFLPYAMALDVEDKWAERFEREWFIRHPEGGPCIPEWYVGTRGLQLADMLSSLGAGLPGALASSAHDSAPHNSSGGGGGGR